MRDGNEIILNRLNEVSDRLGENVTHVEDLKRLSGGASQETWAFYACDSNNRRKLILRRSPFEHAAAGEGQAIGLETEAEVLRALEGSGIPAPGVVYVESEGGALGSAYVMTCIEGETIPKKILRDPKFAEGRDQIAAQCGTALAKLHATDQAKLPQLPKHDAAHQLKQYETILRERDIKRPVFEMALCWLKDNLPDSAQDNCVVHGDFRMGNLMIDERGLAAILDWELCHIGNPREDMGWICTNSWRFGQRDKRVGGVGDLAPLLDAYEAAGGVKITEKEIDYWECLGSFKWGVMCTMMYEAFRSGSDPSIERGSIGRRASETEIDLINILESV